MVKEKSSKTRYEVRRVETSKDWDVFIDLPFRLYQGDVHWVPPLRVAVKDLLDVNKNPFFKHAYMAAFVAYRGSEPVGRIVAVVDETHNKFHNEQTGFFGFFEAIEDQALANLLLDTAAAWIEGRGMIMLRGPMNPSTNHEVGLLVEGFDDSPTVMMTYNPPYYGPMFEKWGLAKAKDLYAYYLETAKVKFADRLKAQAEKLKSNHRVVFRPVNIRKFDEELDQILEIYNDAWEANWGFVPMTPEEFRHMAKDMKSILDPDLVLICEVAGEPAGFALTLPDINPVFKKVPDGKLFPFGIFKLLWNLKGPGRTKTIRRCRILTLGIRRQFQTLGLGPLLYGEYVKLAGVKGFHGGEASWILEDNRAMNRALKFMGATHTKTYRVYDKPLAAPSVEVN